MVISEYIPTTPFTSLDPRFPHEHINPQSTRLTIKIRIKHENKARRGVVGSIREATKLKSLPRRDAFVNAR